jgi:hypothetical protein
LKTLIISEAAGIKLIIKFSDKVLRLKLRINESRLKLIQSTGIYLEIKNWNQVQILESKIKWVGTKLGCHRR